MATKVAPLLGTLADFHSMLNLMPHSIVAYANYIKLAQCNQLCCSSTFVSGKLLYSHLCRNLFHAAFLVSQRNVVRERKNPFLWDDFQLPLRPSFHLLQAPATFFSKFSKKVGVFPADNRSSRISSQVSFIPDTEEDWAARLLWLLIWSSYLCLWLFALFFSCCTTWDESILNS